VRSTTKPASESCDRSLVVPVVGSVGERFREPATSLTTTNTITSPAGQPKPRVHAQSKRSFVQQTDPDTDCEMLNLLEQTVLNTVAFTNDENHSFVALSDCNSLQHKSNSIGNEQLAGLCDVALSYGATRELSRKNLYASFMGEVLRLFSLAATAENNFCITYEDWSKCFNVIFTSVLLDKLKTCSEYKRGGETIVSFREKPLVSNQDSVSLTSHYKRTKAEASADVKDIMRILNLVLRDCCGEDDDVADSAELICTVDYSSIYKSSASFEQEFCAFVNAKISGNANNIPSFKQLALATEPEAVLMETFNKVYNDERLTVSLRIL
jgi:hypothetical protein